MQLLDEGRVAVNSYSEGEFHGIDLKPFCNKTGREPSEGICSMYNAFFDDMELCGKGENQCEENVNIAKALESMLFLSCCVTSNLHFSRWIEMANPDTIQTIV